MAEYRASSIDPSWRFHDFFFSLCFLLDHDIRICYTALYSETTESSQNIVDM